MGDPLFVVGLSQSAFISPAAVEFALTKQGYKPDEFEIVSVEPRLESSHTEVSARADRLATLMASVWGKEYTLSFVVGVAAGTVEGIWKARAAVLRARSPYVEYHWINPQVHSAASLQLTQIIANVRHSTT